MTLPLVVDLDGTLLRSDLLIETGMAYVRSHPFQIHKMAGWLAQGKIELKSHLANSTHIDVSVLPYNATVLEIIKNARKENRKIVLATASYYTLAEKVADHLQLFDLVLATNSKQNLTALKKKMYSLNTLVSQDSTISETLTMTFVFGQRLVTLMLWTLSAAFNEKLGRLEM